MSSWNYARRPFQDHRPAYAVSALLLLAGAALFVANVRIYAEYRRGVAGVRSEIAALETRQHAADGKSREARATLSSYRLSSMAEESRELSRLVAEHRFSWTVLLARLERTLPSDVSLQHLQPQFGKDGGIAVTLQLVGRSREAVVPTLAALAHDPAFSNVELRSETQPEGNTADPFLFEVTSGYSPPEPARPAEKAPQAQAEKKPARKAKPEARP
jgi:Tfp pilus assembly protein PilN